MGARRNASTVERATAASDEELMCAYVSGDEGAFEELFARYAPVLLGMMRRGIPHDDAEVLVQQTFLHVHRARLDYDPTRRLRSWIFTIAMNLKREFFRRKARRPHEVPMTVEPMGNDGRDYFKRATADWIRDAVQTLRPAQRDVIELHWFRGLPFREVAELLGVSVSAAKVRAHRGYLNLRTTLAAS